MVFEKGRRCYQKIERRRRRGEGFVDEGGGWKMGARRGRPSNAILVDVAFSIFCGRKPSGSSPAELSIQSGSSDLAVASERLSLEAPKVQ
jgi:hypothetical protein